jgi:pseudaminic acid biosynthesis-associated methylase
MNSKKEEVMPEARRLEELWAGDFGNEYMIRNRAAADPRGPFWEMILQESPIVSALEVGCNLGANLQWIATKIPPRQVYGVDINLSALAELHRHLPQVNAIWSPARELPFRDRWFDLVFTVGVLIHQPESTLPLVMAEIMRCSRRYILCVEYFSAQTTEVFYRGHHGALFKRDYGRLYQELFPELRLLKEGFLSRAEGWDDANYWLFEKPRA